MPATIIELNDHEVRAGTTSAIAARSPAAAVVQGGDIRVGEDARAEAHLHPRDFHNKFWYQLGQAPLRRPSRAARHHADLAFRHLEHVVRAAGGIDEVVFAIPGGFSKEQLALLLGIAEACKLRVVALVDAAVAATAAFAGPGEYQHIELQQHRAVITRLTVRDDVRRTDVLCIDGAGTERLIARFIDHIADQFLAQSRFDPLHQASTEQLLYGEVPRWLSLLQEKREIRVHIDFRGSRFEARIARDEVIAVADSVYREIRAELAAHVPCLIGSRLASMPGFTNYAHEEYSLPEIAVFAGCASLVDHGDASTDGLALLTRLPATDSPEIVSPTVTSIDQSHARDSSVAITHILCGAHAYPLGERPLFLAGNATATANMNAHTIARIERRADTTVLAPQNGARVRVNDLTIARESVLQAGDKITVEGTSVAFQPIHVLS